MLLSKPRIEQHLALGNITIDPFVPENLGSAQYDVTLGEFCYREARTEGGIYNPFDEKQVREKWQLDRAVRHGDLVADGRICPAFENIGLDEEIILVKPGELILAHTQEFIGGSCNFITTMMKARSSLGRSFFEICRCLPPETILRRASGVPVLLGELREGDRLINVDRYGRSRAATVKAIRRSGEAKQVLDIRTKGGRTFKPSTDHLLRVSRADGLHTIHASEIRVGDEMPVLMRWEPTEPAGVSLAEATMLGYFVAEGNWQQYIVSFAKIDYKVEEREQIKTSMREVFPNAPTAHEYEDKVQYNSVDLAWEFAQRYPETACLGKYKRVPRALFSASREAVRAFLTAYLRCDGHDRKNHDEVQTCSRSPILIADIALLAARLGAVPTFNHRRSGAANRVQYYGLYYGDDAGRIAGRVTDAYRGQNVYIPDLLAQVKNKYGLTREMLAGYATTDRKGISRKRLDTIVAMLPPIEELRPYTADLAWDAVQRVESQQIERTDLIDISLDVETEEDSLFVLNDGLCVLNCAGMGDIGYFNRWTMEIANTSQYHTIPLVRGRRVAQLLFFEVDPVAAGDVYDKAGKYQTSSKLEEIKAQWTPERMLPKQWKDRECARISK